MYVTIDKVTNRAPTWWNDPYRVQYTEQQKKRRMNTIYQHGRLHTGCFETIQVASHPPIGFSGTVMIQNDVRLHISRKRYM